MKVQDNFLRGSPSLLLKLQDKKLWEELDEIQPPLVSRWWDGTGELDTIWKKVIFELWSGCANNTTPKCFEYWVNITDPHLSLGWHQDKDEFEYEKSGKVIHPFRSIVFYGYPHEVEGGYLEINEVGKDDNVEVERIKPVFNRVVLFNPSRVHRVSNILSGKRYGFQVNLWDEIPEGALPFIEGKKI